MITSCPSCNYRFEVPDEYRGRRVACPSCRQGMEVRPAGQDNPPEKTLVPDPPPKPRYRDLPEGGIILRVFAVFVILFSVLLLIGSRIENPFPWLGILGGSALFGLGQIVNYLKRIELWLRPDGYEKK
jgi:hypothetical protein